MCAQHIPKYFREIQAFIGEKLFLGSLAFVNILLKYFADSFDNATCQYHLEDLELLSTILSTKFDSFIEYKRQFLNV